MEQRATSIQDERAVPLRYRLLATALAPLAGSVAAILTAAAAAEIALPRQKGGGSIVVAGPDGTGKSTLARNLLAGPLARERVVHIYGRPKVLPRPSREQAPSAAENRRKPPFPIWLSILRTVYVFVDFVLAWMVHVRPAVRAGGWVVMERGWWDLVVDPARLRLQGSAGLARLLAALGPHPDLFLILEASADVVRSRKEHASETDVVRQARLWQTILPHRVRRAYLDANEPAEVVLQRAEVELRRLNECEV
jgi:thymidylate kinase